MTTIIKLLLVAAQSTAHRFASSVCFFALLLSASASVAQQVYLRGTDIAEGTTETYTDGVACGNDCFFYAGNSLADGASTALYCKTDNSGRVLWVKGLGGGVSYVASNIGAYAETILLSGINQTEKTVFLLKTDKNGHKLWFNDYEPEIAGYVSCRTAALATDRNGNVYIGGYGVVEAEQRGFILKISADGEMLWCASPAEAATINSIICLPEGGVVVCGQRQRSSGGDMYFAAISDNGTVGTSRKQTAMNDFTLHRSLLTDSNTIVHCGIQTLRQQKNIALITTDLLGNILQSNNLPATGEATITALTACADGGVAIAGRLHHGQSTETFLLQANNQLQVDWFRIYTGTEPSTIYYLTQLPSASFQTAINTTDRNYLGQIPQHGLLYPPINTNTNTGNNNLTLLNIASELVHEATVAIGLLRQTIIYGNIRKPGEAGNAPFWFGVNERNDILWAKQSGGVEQGKVISAVADSSTVYMLTQNRGRPSDFSLYKIAANGDTLFYRNYLAPNLRVQRMCITAAGELLIVGNFEEKTLAESGFLLIKLAATGQAVWEKFVSTENSGCVANDVVETADGSVLVGGHFARSDKRTTLAFLQKLQADGSPLWLQTYPTWRQSSVQRIIINKDKTLLIGSCAPSKKEQQDVLVNEINAQGVTQNTYLYNILLSDYVHDATTLTNNNVVIIGQSRDDAMLAAESYGFVLEIDPNFNAVIKNTVGDADANTSCNAVAATATAYTVAGNTQTGWGESNSFLWQKQAQSLSVAPQQLRIETLTARQASLRWKQSSDNETFELQYDITPNFDAPATVFCRGSLADIANLSPATRYYFRVKNAADTSLAPFSKTVSAETPADSNTIALQGEPQAYNIKLHWKPALEQRLAIERSLSAGFTMQQQINVHLSDSIFSDFVAAPGQIFYYRLRGKTDTTIVSNIVRLTMPDVVLPPQNFRLFFCSGESVVLAWRKPANGGLVSIYRQDTATNGKAELLEQTSDTLFTDYNVIAGQHYHYFAIGERNERLSASTDTVAIDIPVVDVAHRRRQIVSKAYPTPSQNTTVIQYKLGKYNKATLRLYNIENTEIFTTELTQSEGEYILNTATLTPGLYFYNIAAGDANGENVNKILIVK